MEYQGFNFRRDHVKIPVFTDPATGLKYTSCSDVLRNFPNVNQILLDNVTLPFMVNSSGELYEPKRLTYHPGKILQLISFTANCPQYHNEQRLQQSHCRQPIQLGSDILSLAYTPTLSDTANQQTQSRASCESIEEIMQQHYHQHREEQSAQIEPMLGTRRTLANYTSKETDVHHHQIQKYGHSQVRWIESLRLRLFLFSLAWTLAASVQLAGLSDIINGWTGESNALKQRVAYWATACTVLNGVPVYFLAKWFTKDLVWHWQTNHWKELWALEPSVTSFSIGLFHVRMPLMIIFTFALTLISITSITTNIWLTSSTYIVAHNVYGSPQMFTFMDLPTPDEDFRFADSGGVAFQTMVTQSGTGAIKLIKLTPYNNKYFWSPFLSPDIIPQTIKVENMKAFSVEPKCTLLSAAELGVTYNQTISWRMDFNFTIEDHAFSIPGARGKRYYWGLEAQIYNTEFNSTSPRGMTVYNVITSRYRDFGKPSFIFSNLMTSYVYATKCDVRVEWWNATGTINSFKPQRLDITDAVKTSEWDGVMPIVRSVYDYGLSKYTKSHSGIQDSTSYNMKSPLWMWMMGLSYARYKKGSVDEVLSDDTTHPNTTYATWVELKLSEIIGATLTTSTTAVMPRQFLGTEVMDTWILIVDLGRIIGGLAIQATLFWIPIVIYIMKHKAGVFYGDDIARLLDGNIAPTVR
ncbi:hypothetical protein BGX27_008417 [Mortierella sp. AM989]|nr:hypothetical protein BGX27_008417 [Mortierella sp. AM989]